MFVRGGRFWMVKRTKESWSFRSTLAWIFGGLVSKPPEDKQESAGCRKALASWMFVRHLRFRLVKNKFNNDGLHARLVPICPSRRILEG